MPDADTGSAEAILRLGNAFCESQALLTAAELDVFGALHGRPATAGEVAAGLGLPGRGVRDLLDLLTGLGLLVREGGHYRNSAAADAHLVPGRAEYVGGFLRGARANLYPVWGGLTETLRTGEPRTGAAEFAEMFTDPDAVARYAGIQDGVLRPLVSQIVELVDWAARRSVLDVGGCQGTLMAALVHAHAGLEGHVFDLPGMRPVFDERMRATGAGDRVRFHAGDFFADPLPAADVVVLGHVLHNWDLGRREHLVRSAFAALPPGGLLVVHDRMLDDEKPVVDNLVASLMMALVTQEGAEYPVSELVELAGGAGFGSVTSHPLGTNETLVICEKAGG